MREALFNILGPSIKGQTFLDLFAGSGGIGLEALSRGAASVTFVERDRAALAALEGNIAMLGLAASTRVIKGDATRLAPSSAAFDVVYIDPPYASGLLEPALANLAAGGQLDAATRIVIEHAAKFPPAFKPPFLLQEIRRYGVGALSFVEFDRDFSA